MDAFQSAKLYKERAKKWHDQRIMNRNFKVGEKVLLFNSIAKLFPGKLVSRLSRLFEVVEVTPFGAVRLRVKRGDFLVNAQRIKHYFEEKVESVGIFMQFGCMMWGVRSREFRIQRASS